MNCILVKVKRLRKDPYRKLISNNSAFESIDTSSIEYIEFEADHHLDEDSWFAIKNFSDKDFCLDILKESFNSTDYKNLEKEQFKNITCLISVQGNDFYFQKIIRSSFIRQKGIVFFGEVAEIIEDDTRLIIKDIPDAIYIKDSDTLIFRNLASINKIFDGIESLYTEATRAEVEQFLNEPFIKLDSGFSIDNVSKLNRKRITSALNVLALLSSDDKKAMFQYINEYSNDTLAYDKDNQEFQVKSDIDLKNLIYGIQERFYTTTLGQEKRLANSIKIIP